jgi:hypothetical protein
MNVSGQRTPTATGRHKAKPDASVATAISTGTNAHAQPIRHALERAGTDIFFHPDCNRRPRHFTGSADPALIFVKTCSDGAKMRALAGSLLSRCSAIFAYRRWGISPRPEDVGTQISPNSSLALRSGGVYAMSRLRVSVASRLLYAIYPRFPY